MRLAIFLLTLLCVGGFVPSVWTPFYRRATDLDAKKTKKKARRKRSPSKVEDKDGPTPEIEYDEPPILDESKIPNLEYDPDNHPVPHQPWRRGDTDGCHDPIHSEWRKEAESIIMTSAQAAGAVVRDVTWYLTSVVITIDNEMEMVDETEIGGPEVEVVDATGPMYENPDNPNPEPIYLDDEPEFAWQKDVEKEYELKKKSIVPRDEDDEDDGDYLEKELELERSMVPLEATEATREEMHDLTREEMVERSTASRPMSEGLLTVDTSKISVIAKYILMGLEKAEEKLRILERHEVILTTPGAPNILETQRQFDAYRGFDVIVETVDPFDSNRTLYGKLLERNSMDVIINKKGRMVTIPLNFVSCVRLPPPKREKGVPRDAPF